RANIGSERPRDRWNQPYRRCGEATAQVFDDRIAVDRVRERLTDTDIAEHSIAEVDAEVLVIGTWSGCDAQMVARFELMHDVRSDVVDDEIHRPFPELESLHDFVGNDPQHETIVRRFAFEVVLERRELDAIIDGVAGKAIRAGADWMQSKIGGRAVGNYRHHEARRKREKRVLQREDNPGTGARLDKFERAESPFPSRGEVRIEKGAERVHDVGGRQLVAIVELHALPQ